MDVLMIIICISYFLYFVITLSPKETNNQNFEKNYWERFTTIERHFWNRSWINFYFDGKKINSQDWERLRNELQEEYKIRRNQNISMKIKRAVFERDNGKCVYCGSRKKIHYDHIKPVSAGGVNNIDNIQLLCEKCNYKKGYNTHYKVPVIDSFKKLFIDFNEKIKT